MKTKNKKVMNSNEIFAELCKLTLQVCGKTEFPAGTFTENGNRWLELVDAWDALIEGGALGIFLDVVHRTMWGFQYSWANPSCDDIARIVQYELLRDREAFKAWDGCNAFEDALHIPANEGTPWLDDHPTYHCSVHHYEYLCTRMLYKLRFSKRSYANERRSCEEAWSEYIRCIGRIVPSSKTWDEAQWANENNIHDEINRLYGFDYRKDPESYYQLYSMLTIQEPNPLRRLSAEAWYSHKINNMPVELVKVLWPKETWQRVRNMFLLAAEGAEKSARDTKRGCADREDCVYFTYKDLRHSWLYQAMNDWHNHLGKTGQFPENIKKKLFEIAMRAN